MSFKRLDGLSVDYDRQVGGFEMPSELALAETLVKMDVLADWMDSMVIELLKACINYFACIFEEVDDESISFEMHFAAFTNMLSGLKIREPANLKENCFKVYDSSISRK